MLQNHSTLIARFFWALIGPLLMLSCLAMIWKAPQSFSLWDAGYIITVALMGVGRYTEQKSGWGTTLYNEPSTWTHFKHYALKLTVFAILLWMFAKYGGSHASTSSNL